MEGPKKQPVKKKKRDKYQKRSGCSVRLDHGIIVVEVPVAFRPVEAEYPRVSNRTVVAGN
jgi:hypothetical protein